jgi:molybdopterin-guanine dinucleotide biosynthesis protein B
MPKFLAVVGGKNSGKTTIIQKLIPTFKRRGHKVATIKNMPQIQNVDSPASNHDTWKHSQAGAEIVVATPQNETVLFIRKKLNLNEAASFLNGFDYVFLEGFSDEKIFPKLIAAKTPEEIEEFSDGLAIAVSGRVMEEDKNRKTVSSFGLPMFKISKGAEKLADLIEAKGFSILPDLPHCGECGFKTCYELAKALVADDPEAKGCPLQSKGKFTIEVNGEVVPLKAFPREFIQKTVTSLVRSLQDVPEIRTLTIKLENKQVS